MDNNTQKISRTELYEQVWTVAITKLSKKYGLSDVGLAKICKKNNIPRPPRGYWAKKAAGYNMKRLPLPPGENVTIAVTPNPYSRNANKNRELVARMSPSIQSEGEPIVVPGRLSSPHLLIKQSSEILNFRQPGDVGLVHPPKKGCLDITVSKSSLRRALHIMDTAIKLLEKLGYNVYLSEGHTKTKIQEAPISFGITVEFIWIMSKYNACKREDIEELIRTPSIRSLISQYSGNVAKMIKTMVAEI